MKTRWLLPVLMIGLAILAVEPSISASDQSLPGGKSAAEAAAVGLELASAHAETPEATHAQLEDAALGTY